MDRFLRLAAASFFCTSCVLLVGVLHEQLPDSPMSALTVPRAARAADLAADAVQMSLMQMGSMDPRRSGADFVISTGLTPPALEPDGWMAVEPIDTPDDRVWTPPEWFPEQWRDELWSLEGVEQEPVAVGRTPKLRSKAAFVYDVDSGEVLLSFNADTRRPVASLTKLVSALAMTTEEPDLDRTVCMDGSARPGWPGAGSKIRTGTCTTGWDLVGAALVRSDNGAAFALPLVAGLEHELFMDRMNEMVADLGMTQSSFADPAGVDDDNLSTARDMTRAVLAASLHPVVAPAASAPFWDVHDQTRERVRRVRTTNKLIDRGNTEILAGKTGYTDTARHCFAGVFRTRDGRRVAITTLGAYRSRNRWSDVRSLLSWVEGGAGR
jgi:serine-type D-Ala-D-Ala endopeptidase (penicillin-binding protein 7)